MVNASNTERYIPWTPIVPKEDTFNNMMSKYEVHDLVVHEIEDIDEFGNFSQENTYGLIFGYRCLDDAPNGCADYEEIDGDGIIFIPELIRSSSATVALLNVISNLGFKKAGFLNNFLDSSKGLDSKKLGEGLATVSEFKKIHHSSNSNIKEDAKKTNGESEHRKETYHFISYIHKGKYLWKLDGRRRGPVKIARVTAKGDWLETLKETIKDQMELNDIEASVLAVVVDPDSKTMTGRAIKAMKDLFF